MKVGDPEYSALIGVWWTLVAFVVTVMLLILFYASKFGPIEGGIATGLMFLGIGGLYVVGLTVDRVEREETPDDEA